MKAVDGVSLTIQRGEAVGLVGESGCGKSTLGRCIVGLYQPTEGEVLLDGTPVELGYGSGARATHRAQIIFQDPYSSLNPRMTVRQTLTEAMRVHHIGLQLKKKKPFGSSEPIRIWVVAQRSQVAHAYPRQLSGGQRQRVRSACGACVTMGAVSLLVADEPVARSSTVSVQV